MRLEIGLLGVVDDLLDEHGDSVARSGNCQCVSEDLLAALLLQIYAVYMKFKYATNKLISYLKLATRVARKTALDLLELLDGGHSQHFDEPLKLDDDVGLDSVGLIGGGLGEFADHLLSLINLKARIYSRLHSFHLTNNIRCLVF